MTIDTNGPLYEVIDAWVDRAPDATAVVMADDRRTYAELDRDSDRIAAALARSGASPGGRVCLLAAKSPATIAAMFGAMRAGFVYVPIDIAAPFPRLAGIVAAANPAALAVLGPGADVADRLAASGVVGPEVPVIDIADLPEADDFVRPAGTDPASTAHIIFTSGSTGVPKGVEVSHRSVRAFAHWAIGHCAIEPGDRCSGLPPLHFDLSTFDIYCTLAAGGELHLAPPDTLLPRQIAEYIAESELDQLVCVPSTLAFVSTYDALPPTGFPSLRRIICCGEVLPGPVVADWMDHNPGAQVTNLYGPTEATVASTYHTVAERPALGAPPVPIGVACTGEEILVLTDDGTEAPDDETGELCIAGVGLSRGYWQAPSLTEAAFVPDPRPGRNGRIYRTGDLGRRDSAGVLHYAGRRDNQIKHRGFRIELGEVEAAVGALSAVAECAVVAVDADNFAGNVICCAVVLRHEGSTGVDALRPELADRLPGYMLPTRWQAVDALPRNANGKVDRLAIQGKFTSHARRGE